MILGSILDTENISAMDFMRDCSENSVAKIGNTANRERIWVKIGVCTDFSRSGYKDRTNSPYSTAMDGFILPSAFVKSAPKLTVYTFCVLFKIL
jgi:hypothetical protein